MCIREFNQLWNNQGSCLLFDIPIYTHSLIIWFYKIILNQSCKSLLACLCECCTYNKKRKWKKKGKQLLPTINKISSMLIQNDSQVWIVLQENNCIRNVFLDVIVYDEWHTYTQLKTTKTTFSSIVIAFLATGGYIVELSNNTKTEEKIFQLLGK